jgi:hypothetical protein
MLPGGATGSASNAKISLKQLINLDQGKNTIDLLSATVGLQVLFFVILTKRELKLSNFNGLWTPIFCSVIINII